MFSAFTWTLVKINSFQNSDLEPDCNCFSIWELVCDLYSSLPIFISFWRIKKKKMWVKTAAQNHGILKAMIIIFLFQNSL